MVINYKELAEKSGLTHPHIWSIFTGRRRASPEVAKAMETLTGIDRRCFLWPEDFPHPVLIQAKARVVRRTRRKKGRTNVGDTSTMAKTRRRKVRTSDD
jgi:transcriptional regulator with XRE-family HTH domain